MFPELRSRGEEPAGEKGEEDRGKEDGGGDARCFPFRFNVEEGARSGGSDSASDTSEFLEDGV